MKDWLRFVKIFLVVIGLLGIAVGFIIGDDILPFLGLISVYIGLIALRIREKRTAE